MMFDSDRKWFIAFELELVVVAENDKNESELKVARDIVAALDHSGISMGRFDSQIKYKTQFHKHIEGAVSELKNMVALSDVCAEQYNAIIVAHPISRIPPRAENLIGCGDKVNATMIPSMFMSSLNIYFTCGTRAEQIKVGKTLGAVIRRNSTYRTNAIELTMYQYWKNEYADVNAKYYSWIVGKPNGIIVDEWNDASREWDNIFMKAGEFYALAIKAARA